jgi:hypothetical protein
MATTSGRPKYDDTFIDLSTPHILKAPYQSVVIPRSEAVNPDDILNELNETKEYTSDAFNVIPWGTNIAASVNYGHGSNSNAAVKRLRKGMVKGYMGQQPFFHPEGGWQYTWEDAKVPEDYYAENRRAVRYVELPDQIDHWEDPIIAFPSTGKHRFKERDIIPVVPTAVFEVAMPEMGVPSRPMVYKGSVSLSGIDLSYGPMELPNPTRVIKYVQNKNIKHVLPQIYDTFIKIAEKKIPIKFKDPNYVVMQASDSEAIDIPLPDGTSFKLRDYQWMVMQNVDSETELIFEIPVNLKDRPDVSHSLAQISAEYEKDVEKQAGRLGNSYMELSRTAPIVDQITNQYIESAPVPELHSSKAYYTVDNALEAFPDGLMPTRAVLRENPRIVVQPEPAGTYPWMF